MTLPSNLIPITVSSGFDLEGNERIHAAQEQDVTRVLYIAPEYPDLLLQEDYYFLPNVAPFYEEQARLTWV